jgi:glucosamine--fructose-6-phosphate aminotransferase (isomerizing)
MEEQFDAFCDQTRSLGELVATQSDPIAARARLLLRMQDVYAVRQIILTGSGDSYFAALAAAPALRAWTGLPVNAMVSMEASRYVDNGRPPLSGRNRGLLVIAISSSGEVARLVEAVQRLRALGALSVAVTGDNQSRLGQSAETVLDIAIPPAGDGPGARSYIASLLGVLHLGIRIAEMLMCMTMGQADQLRRDLTRLNEPLTRLPALCIEPVAEFVRSWGPVFAVDCLGSGPSLASAGYAAAKLVEAAGLHAAAQDAEEFHHLNYFVDDPHHVPAILFAPSKALSRTRMQELISTLPQLGRPYLVITDAADFAPVSRSLVLPEVHEFFAPLLHAIPAALLAAHAALRRGSAHFRGLTGPWRGARGAVLVRDSTIESGTEGQPC